MFKFLFTLTMSLCLAGGALGASMTIVDLPATGTDAAIGISSSNNYTHAFDFGTNAPTVINGVVFEQGPADRITSTLEAVSSQGYGYILDDTRSGVRIYPHEGANHDQADGDSAAMLRDMLFPSSASVDQGVTFTFLDLTPGKTYSIRYYYRKWEGNRPIDILADGESNGDFIDTITIDIDEGGAHYLDYTFEADDTDVTVKFITTVSNNGVHLYGLTCEEIIKVSARNPLPRQDANDISLRSLILSWDPGEFAETHNVYFSSIFDDVNDSVALVSPGQDANSYDPGQLEYGTTYYWRVDEVNSPPDSTVFPGDVWSFATEPYARPIPAQAISVTASSQSPDQGPEKTIDRSGMDANDLHSKDPEGMWISEASEPNGAWIQYEFDKPCQLHQMLVWNYNGAFVSLFGLKDVTIEYSTDGASWSQIKAVFAQAPGKDGYASNTIVEFGEVAVKFVKITANSNWTPVPELNQYGLSEVQFLQIPVSAREPSPESGTTDVAVDVTLKWIAGRGAAEHDVYVSTNEQAVIEGTAPMETVIKAAYSPALDLNTTYYWRVDEVNEAEVPAVWEGSIWNLTTQPYHIIDDFESYNDNWGHIVFQTWIDGYGWNDGMGNSVPGNDTGAAVGYWPAPTIEDVNVYDGSQSMPLTYGVDEKAIAETTAILPSALPVNQHGIKTLSLQFYGNAANVPGQLFIKINGQNVSNYPGSQDDMKVSKWHAWTIDLAAAGVTSMETLTIGVNGGNGMIFIDAIRLYPAAE